MTYYVLALKRAIRTVYIPVLLVILAAASFFAPLLGESEGLPPAGVYSADESDTANRIVEYLCDNGFELCDSEDTLHKQIENGKYNCGVVIKDGITDRLRDKDTKKLVKYITTPSTFATAVYENHISAAIFREYAPYITADLIAGDVISKEEVIDTYFRMMENGDKFTFEVEYARGGTAASENEENERGLTYTMSVSSLLIFALMSAGVCSETSDSLIAMKNRIGVKNAVKSAFLPGLVVRAAGVMLAFSVGSVLSSVYSGKWSLLKLIIPVAIYTVLVTGFSTLVATVCRDVKTVQTVSFFILVAGLVTMPIFTDISLTLPIIGILRNFIPTYWMWICDGSPLLMCTVAVILLPVSLILLYVSKKRE